MNDPAAQLKESATYCKPDDKKRPTLVDLPDFTTFEVCDTDSSVAAPMVTDAYPDNWYIRVMFDELLDPDVEKLDEILDPDTGEGTGTYSGHIADTHPIKLECESVNGGMLSVEYDGYYSPSGNSITWPLGPSLVIKPNHPELVATNKKCQVTLTDVIKDKQGEKVPADQVGPYAFQIAPITPIVIDPSDSGDPDAPTAVDAFTIYSDNIYMQFNTVSIDEASFACDDDDGAGGTKCEFGFADATGAAIPDADTYSYSLEPYGFTAAEYGFGPANPIETGKAYTFELREGGKVKDLCGVETTFGAPSPATNSKVTFTTNPFDFNSSNFGNGDTVAALKKPSLAFNNVIDPASLDANEYTLTPAPELAFVDTSSEADLYFFGNYRPGTEYTLTLKNGASVVDAFGATYTQDGDKKITWTVAPIAISSTSPANNGTVTQGAMTNAIALTFNQAMDATSVDASEWEVTDANGAVVPFNAAVTPSGCAADGSATSCKLVFTSSAQLPVGDYTFTLKAGAQINDVLASPTTYAQAADRVINFSVVAPGPTPTPIQCL